MAKLRLTEWLKGINTRLNKFRISPTEASMAVDVDLSNMEIRPQKGINASDNTFDTIDHKFRGYSVTDSTATKFTESGDYLIKSYDGADAKFDRIRYDTNANSKLQIHPHLFLFDFCDTLIDILSDQ